MGNRYYVDVTCPKCNAKEEGVYYAPTCGFLTWTCPSCGCVIDLEKLTGISYEEASNRALIEEICGKI